MTAQSAPSPAPLKPLVLLSGDSRILQPLRMELERSGLARAKTMRDFYPSREAPNPVVFHNAVKMANSTEDGGVFCVLHYEFSGDRARNPYFVVDTLDTSSGRDILGDVNYFMLLGPGAFANRGFARARGSQSAHPPLYEVIGQMKRTWRAIAQKTGVDDAWAAFNMAVSKYLGGTIDQPAWTFIPLDVMSSFFGPGPASRKMRGAIYGSSRLQIESQLFDFQKALLLDIPRESEWKEYRSLNRLDSASVAGNRIPSYQLTFSQHPSQARLAKAIVEGSLSWIEARLGASAAAPGAGEPNRF